MKKASLLIALCLICMAFGSAADAQTSVKTLPEIPSATTASDNVYENQTIYLNVNMTKYTKNTASKRVGLFARLLKKEFEACTPESKEEMARCLFTAISM